MLSLLFLCLLFQTSTGTTALETKIVNGHDPDCSMTDLAATLVNDRLTTCVQSQTHFFNGETRAVNSGTGIYALGAEQIQNLYELTSCACSRNATWTRTFTKATSTQSSFIRWNWKLYGRKDDCSLELKRDLTLYGCWLPFEDLCDCPEGTFSVTRVCECVPYSPVIIDLEGDGVRLSSRADGVQFDLDGDGTRRPVPWTRDAWLVLNDRLDFQVYNGQALFGDRSPQPAGIIAGNGYTALSVFDDNLDGVIDVRDGVWPLLALWQDENWNGVSDFGEVFTLDAAGVTVISLAVRESRRTDAHGNEFRYRAKVTVRGKEHWSYDVFLSAD